MRSLTPIAILLSTYNGESYLKEQIDSIIHQTNNSWTLFIRDDGSKDSTVDIIHQYSLEYPSRIYVMKDMLGNLGSGKSFMELLSKVDSDYYMFCDQDDVWLPDKIERVYAKIKYEERLEKNQAICIFSDLCIVDMNLRIVAQSLWNYSGIDPNNCKDVYNMILFGCPVFGCTLIFNSFARGYLLPYPGWKYHDLWTALVISGMGKLDYIPEQTILYRQHGNNVTGAHKKIDRRHYIHSLRNLRNTISDQKKKLVALKKLPYHISLWKIVWQKFLKCIRTLLHC